MDKSIFEVEEEFFFFHFQSFLHIYCVTLKKILQISSHCTQLKNLIQPVPEEISKISLIKIPLNKLEEAFYV